MGQRNQIMHPVKAGQVEGEVFNNLANLEAALVCNFGPDPVTLWCRVTLESRDVHILYGGYQFLLMPKLRKITQGNLFAAGMEFITTDGN